MTRGAASRTPQRRLAQAAPPPPARDETDRGGGWWCRQAPPPPPTPPAAVGQSAPPPKQRAAAGRGGPRARSVSNSAGEVGGCPIGWQKRSRVPLGPRPLGGVARLAVGRREPPLRDAGAGLDDWLRPGAKCNAGKSGAWPELWARRGRGGGGFSSGIAGTGAASGAGAASERCGEAAAASLGPLLWPGAAADFADPLGGGRGGREAPRPCREPPSPAMSD